MVGSGWHKSHFTLLNNGGFLVRINKNHESHRRIHQPQMVSGLVVVACSKLATRTLWSSGFPGHSHSPVDNWRETLQSKHGWTLVLTMKSKCVLQVFPPNPMDLISSILSHGQIRMMVCNQGHPAPTRARKITFFVWSPAWHVTCHSIYPTWRPTWRSILYGLYGTLYLAFVLTIWHVYTFVLTVYVGRSISGFLTLYMPFYVAFFRTLLSGNLSAWRSDIRSDIWQQANNDDPNWIVSVWIPTKTWQIWVATKKWTKTFKFPN